MKLTLVISAEVIIKDEVFTEDISPEKLTFDDDVVFGKALIKVIDEDGDEVVDFDLTDELQDRNFRQAAAEMLLGERA